MGCRYIYVCAFDGIGFYRLPASTRDQKAYWATVVGTSMAGTIPVAGNLVLYFVRGGPEVDGTTLIRFYSMHILILPLLMAVVLWLHFHMVKRQGISGGM